MSPPIRVGIVTVSDRASRGEYQDLGGPAIHDCLKDILSCDWQPVPRRVSAKSINQAKPVVASTRIFCKFRSPWIMETRASYT